MADDPLPVMIEASGAGMDVNDYLAWVRAGVGHGDAMAHMEFY